MASLNQNENIINANISVAKDQLVNHSINPTGRTFGRELTNFGRKNDSTSENTKLNSLRSNKLKEGNGLGMKGTNNTDNNTKMNIEYTKVNETKDTQPKQQSTKSFISRIISDDEEEQQEEEEHEIDPIDLNDLNDPQYVVPYVKEIFEYLRGEESKYLPKEHYMIKVQTDINEKMRGILIDWLIDVHLKFKLIPETLYLTVNLIDRYLSHVVIPRQKLQLVGVTAMLIASKYEEIYPPEVKDFEYVTDKAYTREEILEMEGKMLHCFNFNLTMTSSFRFLERFAKVSRFEEKDFNLSRYLIELALIEFKMIKYVPSNIACGAIYLVNKLEKREGWPEIMAKHTKYKEAQLRASARDLCLLLQNAGKSNLQAIKRKFSSSKFCEVAKIQWDK